MGNGIFGLLSLLAVVVLATAFLVSPMSAALASLSPSGTPTVKGHASDILLCTSNTGYHVALDFEGQGLTVAHQTISGNGTLEVHTHDPAQAFRHNINFSAGKIDSHDYMINGTLDHSPCSPDGKSAKISVFGLCGSGVQVQVQTSDGAKAQLVGDISCAVSNSPDEKINHKTNSLGNLSDCSNSSIVGLCETIRSIDEILLKMGYASLTMTANSEG